MRENGYFGIGCLNMKTGLNYGTLFRTAQIFNADFIFLIGRRFKKMPTDTMNATRHIPLYCYDTFEQFNANRPHGCVLVGIELDEKATPISEFKLPRQACYLLGAEDSGLTKEALEKCQELIQLPGTRSLNVAVAGSIVLFDRINKRS